VHRRVAPSLVVEPAFAIEVLEVLRVRLAAPEVEVPDFEVGPEVAFVVSITVVIRDETERVIFGHKLRIRFHEFFRSIPERRDRLDVLIEGQSKSVELVIILHEQERVVVHVAIEVDSRFYTPLIVEVFEKLVSVEEA